MNVPEKIHLLDQKPGNEWTEDEIRYITHWWMERSQEKLIWIAACKYLGDGATKEDIEDAWASFYTEEIDISRRSYRPGGPGYVIYAIHVCFKRSCFRRGSQIRKSLITCTSLTNDNGVEISTLDVVSDTAQGTHSIVEQRMIIDEVLQFLEKSSLSKQQKLTFTLKHFSNLSDEEIALELGAELKTVRVWAHRAAGKVHEHLKELGWTN